jgi:hypothetical protein
MQSIQIDGTFTYAKNIRNLKIGDQIRLLVNSFNRLNSEAIGAYTMSGNKIGYVPFKATQIDIKSKYTVTKLNLTQQNPILLISRHFENTNFIPSEPEFIKDIKYINECINTNLELINDLKYFGTYLKKSSTDVRELKITYHDINYVNLLIKTLTDKSIFWTVTKKYYEENIFKYDEFYKFKLIPKCVYQQFQIHRLEDYIKIKYKPIDKLIKMKKFKLESLINSNIFDLFDKINQYNFGFEQIKTSGLKTISKTDIAGQVYNQEQLDNLLKLIIQYEINHNSYYKPSNYLEYINSKSNFNFKPNLDEFINMFDEIKLGGLCYNHTIKYYSHIDLYDDNNIIEIFNDKIINNKKFVELLLKLVIANKSIINLYNPIEGVIHRLEIPELIKINILKLI